LTTATMSAANSLGVSEEALDIFLQLVSLTNPLTTGRQAQEMDFFQYGSAMERLIEEYDRKL